MELEGAGGGPGASALEHEPTDDRADHRFAVPPPRVVAGRRRRRRRRPRPPAGRSAQRRRAVATWPCRHSAAALPSAFLTRSRAGERAADGVGRGAARRRSWRPGRGPPGVSPRGVGVATICAPRSSPATARRSPDAAGDRAATRARRGPSWPGSPRPPAAAPPCPPNVPQSHSCTSSAAGSPAATARYGIVEQLVEQVLPALVEGQVALQLVEHGEAGRQPGLDRELEQQPAGEGVERADGGLVEPVERRSAAVGGSARRGGGGAARPPPSRGT